MPYYTSKFRLNNSKSPVRSTASSRNVSSRKWSSVHSAPKAAKKRVSLRQRIARHKKVFMVGCGMFIIVLIIAGIYIFGYLQSLTESLPSPEAPFGEQSSASEIYDRNGKLLYRMYGDENRDVIGLDNVPQLMQWAVLAAEDIDFYQHPGVDITGIARCAVKNIAGTSSCGGSTITQQLIKQTALTNERSYERKIKEVILALEIEQQRSKEEILEMYLNVIPEGSNLYGLKSAANEYFGRELDQLNLAEFAVLASIPQDPNNMSPTKSTNENAQANVKNRQMYVLGEMEKYKDKINAAIYQKTGQENALTQEMIDEAKNYQLVYATSSDNEKLKAPHFVFYVQKLLEERNYNNGEPFSAKTLETSGLKIYTTLDLDIQEIAEEQVKKAVDVYGSKYGGKNAAMVSVNPNNGEILAMVGSYDYFGESYPEGCTGSDCMFNPQVNVVTSLQSYGSSLKPMIYYYALKQGLITAGSVLPDIPIKIGNYTPKNFSSNFTGLRTARLQLRDSQNIPAIYLLNTIGVNNFITEMQKWGYSTFTDPRGYGPSMAVGGAEVKLIDHAMGYSVLANGGKYIQNEAVLKIEDKDGNVIYQYDEGNALNNATQVADPNATYIISNILNANNDGPALNAHNGGSAYSAMGTRDIAGKTGTSEDNKETLFATYTPEIVTVGWLGNNNNKEMKNGVSGFNSARPWVAEFMLRVSSYFKPTSFTKPSGVISVSNCEGENDGDCDGIGQSDLGISGINAPKYLKVKTYTVCTDETTKLARQVDIDLGLSTAMKIKSYIMPDSSLQSTLDTYLKNHTDLGGIVPTESCDINRNPQGNTEPWADISAPASGESVSDGSLEVQYNAYTATTGATITKTEVYIDGNGPVANSTTLPYANTFVLSGSNANPGNHTLMVKVYDSTGAVGSTSRTFTIPDTAKVTASSGSGNTVKSGKTATVNYTFSSGNPDSATLFVNGSPLGSCTTTGVCTYSVPAVSSLEIYVQVNKSGAIYTSPKFSLTVD